MSTRRPTCRRSSSPASRLPARSRSTESPTRKEWEGAVSTGLFVDVGTGKPNPLFPVSASAKLLWDEKNLYVLFVVQQAEPYVGFTNAKAHQRTYGRRPAQALDQRHG